MASFVLVCKNEKQIMITLRKALLATLLSLTACGGGSPSQGGQSAGDSPMAGNWTAASGKKLTFDGSSNKLNAHGIPLEDGRHDHAHGTYTYDAKTQAVTLTVSLFGLGKGDAWQGSVVGESLNIQSGEAKLVFTKGGVDDGH